MHETRSHETSCFLTLTYRDEDFPGAYTARTKQRDGSHRDTDYVAGSINVGHFQSFMKRLRRNEQRAASKEGRQPITYRYFHCGEYGKKGGRPHYHAALFGADFKQGSLPHDTNKWGDATWTNPDLDRVWGKGAVIIGGLTTQSAQYVARYILKKRNGPTAAEHYKGRKPEYVTMSRRPGLGQKWYDEFKNDVYPRDELVHDQHLRRPPRYYDFLKEQEAPELIETLKKIRIKEGKRYAKTSDQLDTLEKLMEHRQRRTIRHHQI